MSDAAASACATIDRVVANLQNDSIVAHDRPAVRCVGKELGALRRCRFLIPPDVLLDLKIYCRLLAIAIIFNLVLNGLPFVQ